jgi:hypothetical protein
MAEVGDIPENVPEVEEQPPSPPAQVVKHEAVPKVPVEKPAEVVGTESLALKTPAPASGPASRLSSLKERRTPSGQQPLPTLPSQVPAGGGGLGQGRETKHVQYAAAFQRMLHVLPYVGNGPEIGGCGVSMWHKLLTPPARSLQLSSC